MSDDDEPMMMRDTQQPNVLARELESLLDQARFCDEEAVDAEAAAHRSTNFAASKRLEAQDLRLLAHRLRDAMGSDFPTPSPSDSQEPA